MNLSESFWNNRYLNHDTGWDLGQVSPPLKGYFDQLTDKDLKILIPGGGNSYEAEYLFTIGFKNTSVVDLSTIALDNIKERVPEYPLSQLIHGDFFDLKGRFDLIIEQTFFCAIDPQLRPLYAQKSHELLETNGKLVGLLFDAPLNSDRPPFGGTRAEYLDYFKPLYNIGVFETCYNSIESRFGNELFIKMTKV
ncbi:TPMT family class I SAM-dependent methyltransferase [Aestuariivivens sediminicola]|uniref:TPMT family class I SAM-dependent methyltransferase n=1 Tax=Aestuariivivens sediminicola TaxID=2913560 RepID=UPI001F5689C6|nr:TPMT family class I SAM-dependent methyltransferase [Aestuariivivens sediminicola]